MNESVLIYSCRCEYVLNWCVKMFCAVLLAIGIVSITYYFFKLTSNNARYFRERNLKYRGARDTLRVMLSVFLGKIDIVEMTKKSYDHFPDEPYVL